MFGLVRHRSIEDHEPPFRVRIRIPLFLIAYGLGWRVHAGSLVIFTEVELDEATLLEGVLDWIAMVVAQHLNYLVKVDMVELASLLLMDSIDRRDEVAVVAPLVVLLAFHPSIAVFSLVRRFGLSLALVLAKICMDNLLAGGVACHKVEQLPRHPWFTVSKPVNECFIDHARDKHPDHVCI